MPTADGVVTTPRAARYLVQLCRHAARMGPHPPHLGRPLHPAGSPEVRHSEWTDADGLLRLGDGVCTLRATPDALLLHVDAPDGAALRRIQHLLTARLEGFGRREGLQVDWLHPPHALSDDHNDAAAAGPGRWGAPMLGTVLAVALVVALHLGLVGALLAAPRWATGAVELVVAAIAVKVFLVVLLARRRRRTH